MLQIRTVSILALSFVAAGIEVLLLRQLSTVAGNSLIVISIVLSFTVASWTFGLASTYNNKSIDRASWNLIIASLVMILGTSYIFVNLFFSYVNNQILQNILYTLAMYLLITVVPINYLLSYAVGLNYKNRNSLIYTGIGLSLGFFITAGFLINYAGTVITSFILLSILLLTALLLAVSNKQKIIFTFLSIIALLLSFLVNVKSNPSYYSNIYSDYVILNDYIAKDGKVGNALIINNSASSFLEYDTLKGFDYIERLKKLLFKDLSLRNKNILVLGSGGFSLSAENEYQNRFTYVDIDPDIKKVAKAGFIENVNGRFVDDDARIFLQKNKLPFDAIVVDVYGSGLFIPEHLLTKEYFKLLYDNVVINGTVAFNMAIKPSLDDLYSQTVDNTLRQVFKSCMVIPASYVHELNNVLYVCRKNDNNLRVYIDDKNNSVLDGLKP